MVLPMLLMSRPQLRESSERNQREKELDAASKLLKVMSSEHLRGFATAAEKSVSAAAALPLSTGKSNQCRKNALP